MLIMLTENIDVVFAEISISAIQKSVNLYLAYETSRAARKTRGAMERGLRLDEKKSFISGGFVVYLPPLMLRANTINWKLSSCSILIKILF